MQAELQAVAGQLKSLKALLVGCLAWPARGPQGVAKLHIELLKELLEYFGDDNCLEDIDFDNEDVVTL